MSPIYWFITSALSLCCNISLSLCKVAQLLELRVGEPMVPLEDSKLYTGFTTAALLWNTWPAELQSIQSFSYTFTTLLWWQNDARGNDSIARYSRFHTSLSRGIKARFTVHHYRKKLGSYSPEEGKLDWLLRHSLGSCSNLHWKTGTSNWGTLGYHPYTHHHPVALPQQQT